MPIRDLVVQMYQDPEGLEQLVSKRRKVLTGDKLFEPLREPVTWLEAPPNESAIQSIARNLERHHDHDNLSGSILVLALLRPHLYMDDPVPLRVFGYPAPHELLAMDASPHSGGGPDSKRTNLLEALCAFWLAIDSPASRHCFHAVQDVWHVMRVRADIVLKTQKLGRPISAHKIFFHALQVPDHTLIPRLDVL